MGELGNRSVSRRHNLFMDDLKQYQESHKVLNDVIEIIVQASRGTGSCYGVSKCAEIVFKHWKMVTGKRLLVFGKRMEAMDFDERKMEEDD